MNNKLSNTNNNIIFYTTDDGKINVEVYLEEENIWLNQEQISKLFEKSKSTINEHIMNIYREGELERIRDIRSSEKVFWRKIHEEYDKYMQSHLTQAEKDYLEIMGEDIKKLK